MRSVSALRLPDPRFHYIPFAGGLDLETPVWEIPDGFVREGRNYEIGISGGYQDILGYERFDGRPAPHLASYAILPVTITGSIDVGDTITQDGSGATAQVAYVGSDDSGEFLVVTKVSGSFASSGDLLVSAVVEAETAGAIAPEAAPTAALAGLYRLYAANRYRADITAVPGQGAVLGVWMLGSTVYAWRTAVGGATVDMYRSSVAGWSLVALGRELPFTSGGTVVIEEGDTITGATSGATAVITRVVVESGDWTTGDAAGRLIFASQTGTFGAENLNVGSDLNVATIAGNSTAISMAAGLGQRFRFYESTFGGAYASPRLYGVDGVNRGFEWDGTVFVPISSGMAVDAPTHVIEFMGHLCYAFGRSFQHSAIREPYAWSPLLGAAEIATAGLITGFHIEQGADGVGALAIMTRQKNYMLYGTSAADWQLIPGRDEIGAFPDTIQNLSFTMFLDDRGLTSQRASDAFGNFAHSALSSRIQRFLAARRQAARSSCIVRDKNQYRLFFSDKQALYVTMQGDKLRGFMPVVLDHEVRCICSKEAPDGTERIFFGAENGMVYEMERGYSFDGEPIDAYLALHFSGIKSQGWLKTFMSGVLEARGGGYADFTFGYELAYGDQAVSQPDPVDLPLVFSEGRWDVGNWDTGFWDGKPLGPSRVRISGEAENISIVLRKDSAIMAPVTFSGIRIRYILRRQLI